MIDSRRFMYFAGAVLAGLVIGFVLPIEWASTMRTGEGVSNQASVASLVERYKGLPCPSPEEFQSELRKIKFSGRLAEGVCSEGATGQLSRLLHFTASLATDLPEDWTGGAREALEDPLAYIGRMAGSTDLDLKQESVAYNKGGKISLGTQFFTLAPEIAISVLVHEARHSDEVTPSHIKCRWGDLAGRPGSCDDEFQVDSGDGDEAVHAGSYAFQTSFMFGLAAYNANLTTAGREELLSEALWTLASRFNFVPESLALPIEQLIVLDEDGRLFEVDPITGLLEALGIEPTQGKIVRIEHWPATSGLIAFGSRGEAFTYDPLRNIVRLGEENGGGPAVQELFKKYAMPPRPVRDVAILSYGQGVKRDVDLHFLSTDHQLFLIDVNRETGKREARLVQPAPLRTRVRLERIVHAQARRFGLGADGQAYTEGEKGWMLSAFQHADRWRYLHGGLFFGSLIGVTTKGEVKYFDDQRGSSEDLSAGSKDVLKLQSAITFRLLLLSENRVIFESSSDQESRVTWNLTHPKRIVDAAMVRFYEPASRFAVARAKHRKSIETFKDECRLESVLGRLWSWHPVGLDREGQLITQSSQRSCEVVDLSLFGLENRAITTVRLVGKPRDEQGVIPSDTALEIHYANGKTAELKPYFFSRSH